MVDLQRQGKPFLYIHFPMHIHTFNLKTTLPRYKRYLWVDIKNICELRKIYPGSCIKDASISGLICRSISKKKCEFCFHQ